MNTSELAALSRSYAFQRRVDYLMVKAAIAKLNAVTPPAEDILLGQRILDGAEPVERWTVAVLTNTTIAAGSHPGDGDTIVDNDLEFAVNSLWSAFVQ